MRLVDADALMQTYAKFVALSNNSDFENEPTWNDAVSLLESAQTVDAVEVVRCKDCKHYRTRWVGFCELIGNENIHRENDDFCSGGERRKDESLVDIQSDQ